MRLYISGPMTGGIDWNFPIFARAKTILESRGHDVVSPTTKEESAAGVPDPYRIPEAWSCPTRSGMSAKIKPGDVMERDIRDVLSCEGIVMLPGWMASAGARLEALVAITTGRKVFEFDATLLREIGHLIKVKTVAEVV